MATASSTVRVSRPLPTAASAPPGEWTPPEPLTPAEAALAEAFAHHAADEHVFLRMLGEVAARALARRQGSLGELAACGYGRVLLEVKLHDGRFVFVHVSVDTTDKAGG